MDFWRWKGMFSAELTPLSLEAPLVGDPAPAVLCWFPVLSPKRDLQAPQFLEVWASLFLLNRGGILKTHIRPCFRSDKHCCFFSCSRSGKLKKKKRKESKTQYICTNFHKNAVCCELWIATVLCVFRQQVESLYPRSGWVELDPEMLWSQFVGVIKEAVQGNGL